MAISASGNVQSTSLGGGTYSYTITLSDTGTTAIGTFWFAWNPGMDFLLTAPLSINSPAGWSVALVSHGANEGYGIEWVAGSSANYLAAGAALSGFAFTSTDTPAQVLGNSPYNAGSPTTDSYVYETTASATPGFDILQMACFAAGTRVATTEGAVTVECLAVGDIVRLANGGTAPVQWLGQRRVDCRNHPMPATVWPVRVRADAFAPGAPVRDLLLSPDHAVYVDGWLIPIRTLINDTSIVQKPVATVSYWHVELDRHSVLLAEGLACESYLDTGNRDCFANAGPLTQLYPGFGRGDGDSARACAPLLESGPVVAAIRARLAAFNQQPQLARPPRSAATR